MSFSHKTRVGILRGGMSPEYEISLNTGKTIISNMPEEYEPLDIFISKEGVWHTMGREKNPYDILKMVDVVVNATHGFYGEDGTVQKLLENFGIPYTGSNSVASAIGMNKILSKNIFNRHGLKIPHYIVIEQGERNLTDKINESLPFPVVVKPINSGSSLGVFYVSRIGDLENVLKKSFEYAPKLMVEEFIDGKEATCGVIEDFRGQHFYTLPPAEIVAKTDKKVFDFDSKYSDSVEKYRIPGNFSTNDSELIQEAAVVAHRALGLRHYSRSDFILHPRRGLFILEVNTLPGLTHRSSFVKSLEAVGGSIKEFLSHLIAKALGKK